MGRRGNLKAGEHRHAKLGLFGIGSGIIAGPIALLGECQCSTIGSTGGVFRWQEEIHWVCSFFRGTYYARDKSPPRCLRS